MSNGIGDDGGGGSEMTLAFDLAAIDRFANPRAVFADARRWSRYVGVVANDTSAAEAYARRHGFRQDFELGTLDRQSVLSKLKWEADTARYVFVGTCRLDRELADHVGWEYVPAKEAAAAADWTLTADAGLVERVRTHLPQLSSWSR